MPRYFNNDNNNYLSAGDVANTDIGAPYTLMCWAYQFGYSATARTMISKHAAGTARHYIMQVEASTAPSSKLGFFMLDSGGTGQQSLSDQYSIKPHRWQCLVGRAYTPSGEISSWVDGVKGELGKTTLATQPAASSSAAFQVGHRNTSATPMNGAIAHIGMWNVALSDFEIQALARGAHPMTIARQAMVAYYPLNTGDATERDWVGGDAYPLTENGNVPLWPDDPLDKYRVTQFFKNAPQIAGVYEDSATVRVTITPSAAEIADTGDSATVFIDLQVSSAENYVRSDAATIPIDISFLGGECFSTFSGLMMDAEADTRWYGLSDATWLVTDASTRWEIGDIQVEGVNC